MVTNNSIAEHCISFLKAEETKKAKKAQDDDEDRHSFDIEQQQPKQAFVIWIFLFIYYNNE